MSGLGSCRLLELRPNSLRRSGEELPLSLGLVQLVFCSVPEEGPVACSFIARSLLNVEVSPGGVYVKPNEPIKTLVTFKDDCVFRGFFDETLEKIEGTGETTANKYF